MARYTNTSCKRGYIQYISELLAIVGASSTTSKALSTRPAETGR
jgi:hypothetical protein